MHPAGDHNVRLIKLIGSCFYIKVGEQTLRNAWFPSEVNKPIFPKSCRYVSNRHQINLPALQRLDQQLIPIIHMTIMLPNPNPSNSPQQPLILIMLLTMLEILIHVL